MFFIFINHCVNCPYFPLHWFIGILNVLWVLAICSCTCCEYFLQMLWCLWPLECFNIHLQPNLQSLLSSFSTNYWTNWFWNAIFSIYWIICKSVPLLSILSRCVWVLSGLPILFTCLSISAPEPLLVLLLFLMIFLFSL